VVGDEIAAVVLDRVVVTDDLDASAVRILSSFVVLANAETERMRSAQLRQVRKFELMRRVGGVVGADDDVLARHTRKQPRCSAAVVFDGFAGCLTSGCHWAGASSQGA